MSEYLFVFGLFGIVLCKLDKSILDIDKVNRAVRMIYIINV